MRKQILLLIGPTIMIFLGLYYFRNVPLTFLLFYGWLFFFPTTYLLFKKEVPAYRKNSFNRKALIVGVLSGLFCMGAIFGVVSLLIPSIFDITELQALLVEWGFSGKHLLELIFILLFINPVLEEIYWRGFMHDRLEAKIGVKKAIILTSFFYSLYHLLSLIPMFSWPLNFIAVLPVFAVGIVWGYFRWRLNSIVAPIVSHVFADLGIMLVYLLYVHS